jgi:hypothetical protein
MKDTSRAVLMADSMVVMMVVTMAA